MCQSGPVLRHSVDAEASNFVFHLRGRHRQRDGIKHAAQFLTVDTNYTDSIVFYLLVN